MVFRYGTESFAYVQFGFGEHARGGHAVKLPDDRWAVIVEAQGQFPAVGYVGALSCDPADLTIERSLGGQFNTWLATSLRDGDVELASVVYEPGRDC